jgi:hypothetical protein
LATETAGNWFEDLLSPQKPVESKAVRANKSEAINATRFPEPYQAPMTDPWKRLLNNVKELFPELLGAMQTLQRLGVTISQGEQQFFLTRGTFLPEKDFEALISTFYFHVILVKIPQGSKMYDIFDQMRLRSVKIKDAGNGLRLVPGEFLSREDWEQIKKELLQPNRDEVLRLLRMAREEVNFILSLSRMAQVIPHSSGLEWDELGK